MRTKALLLTAALGLAGAASSMAQAVYSVNVVGYINLTMKPGFNLVANQLKASPNNKLDTVLPAAAIESQVLKFSNNNYSSDISDGANWLDANSGNPSATVLAPGKGFFFSNPGATKGLTFVGEVPQGAVNLTLPAGIACLGTTTPQALELSAANGFPQLLEAQVQYFDNVANDYVSYINDGTQWLDANSGNPVTVTPAVGQGWFWQNATANAWNRNFTVQ